MIASVLDIPSETSEVLTPRLVAPWNGVPLLVGEKRPLSPTNPLALVATANPSATVKIPLVSEGRVTGPAAVSYTHLTLPTIYSV